MSNEFSRRRLMGTLGAGLSSFFLPSLLGDGLRAQAAAPPKRLVVFYHYHGTVYDNWAMHRGQTDDTVDWDYTFDDPDPNSFSPILRPLHALRSNLTVVDGLDLTMALKNGAGSHGPGYQALRGTHNGPAPSLDQLIASKIKNPAGLPSLELACSDALNINFADGGSALPVQHEPTQLWQRLFPGADDTPSPAPTDDELVEKEQGSVLAAVRERFASLAPRLSGEDRRKLELHHDLLNDLEKSLIGLATANCGSKPPKPEGIEFGDYEKRVDQNTKLITTALSCDLTRVVTLQTAELKNTMFDVPLTVNVHNEYHHDVQNKSHPDSSEVVTRYNAKNAELVANLASGLNAISEGTGTVLDNTLILWLSELGRGDHNYYRMPVVLVGGKNLIKTGRYLKYGRTFGSPSPFAGDPNNPAHSGPPYNKLLVALARAYGVDTQQVGETSFTDSISKSAIDATGPLPRLL